MSWVKVDDQFPDHPKVTRVGMAGIGLYITGLCYCARMLTDGDIPDTALIKLTGLAPRQSRVLAGALVEAGLWERCPVGFHVHDYLEYQPSRAQILTKRAAENKRKGKGFRAESRRIPHAPDPTPDPTPDPKLLSEFVGGGGRPNLFVLIESQFGAGSITSQNRDDLLIFEQEHPQECIEHCFKAAALHVPRIKSFGWVKAMAERHRREGCDGNGKRKDSSQSAEAAYTEEVDAVIRGLGR